MNIIDILHYDSVKFDFIERDNNVLVRTSDIFGFRWFSASPDMSVKFVQEKCIMILQEIQAGSKKYSGIKEISL